MRALRLAGWRSHAEREIREAGVQESPAGARDAERDPWQEQGKGTNLRRSLESGSEGLLHEHRETALLSRRLATIDVGAPLPADLGTAERGPADAAALDALCEELRFGPMTRRRMLSA